ncbi:TPA: hypothetical protein ACPZQZ_001937 [Yersinia enterocolitica]|uniref:hypothetical protein n=1 Tax=Yersinia enterocolitica TaxID=630 RepID=UPI0003167B3D|nr:hypothetical protein [Yersinia enterocolitica]
MKIIKAAPFDRYNFSDEHLSFIDKLFLRPKHEQFTFNQRMFDEDFARVFFSVSRRSGNLFSIESNNDEFTQRLFGNIKTRYGFHRIDETVHGLVEEIAQSLVWFGTAYYFLHDLSAGKEICIRSFSAVGVSRVLNTYFQWVPRRREKHWSSDDEELTRELRVLDKAKLMHFSMPRSIRRMLSAQNRMLVALDKHQYNGTRFYPKATHENPTPKNDFDFHVWKDTQDRALQRATRETGWNGRVYDSSTRSDFFVCHRLIRFRRNQLTLRDYILDQLGLEFTRVGRQYDAEFRIAISPTNVLPSADQLNDLGARLSREEVSFTEVLDFCYGR